MIKITSLYYTYDQEGNVEGYNVSFNGQGGKLQSFSGNVVLSAEETDLRELKDIILEELHKLGG